MKYQKKDIYLQKKDNTSNQLSKFRTKNWVETNDLGGRYNTNRQINFKTKMLKSSL